MPRPSLFVTSTAWLLAAAVGIALAAPPGCSPHTETAADAAPAPSRAETPTQPVALADTVEAHVWDVKLDAARTRSDIPDGFVRLSEAVPSIAQEIRYTTSFNFVGEPIDGYLAPECIVTEAAADALREVAADLARDGLGLKVYDCYRPQTAVDHFVRWAQDGDESMKRSFYPEEPKSRLFQRGYIARRSGHSRGSTVDLTLVRRPVGASVVSGSTYPDPAAGPLPRCDRPLTGPAGSDLQGGGRFPERDLDMGTAYDCLSPLAATASGGVSAEAQSNRRRLSEAMGRRGFRNYTKEWWHFTLRGEPYARTYFDFPVD